MSLILTLIPIMLVHKWSMYISLSGDLEQYENISYFRTPKFQTQDKWCKISHCYRSKHSHILINSLTAALPHPFSPYLLAPSCSHVAIFSNYEHFFQLKVLSLSLSLSLSAYVHVYARVRMCADAPLIAFCMPIPQFATWPLEGAA